MNVLVTGGAGYIGTHTVVELVNAGHDVVIVDNLVNSSAEAVHRVEKLTDRKIPFYKIDVADKAALGRIFDNHRIDAVIHFAGLKAVGESIEKPLLYYRNNIDSTLSLCEVMQEKGVTKMIFSSSATVYGPPQELPITEDHPVGATTNPYGQTKVMIEQILRDIATADSRWQISLLRYFNPVGAHKSGRIGEDPHGLPNNLMPYISRVAVGNLKQLTIHGNDYDTPDGTGIRDYIHVVDLAKGHVAALEHLPPKGVAEPYNLGTGKGTSVLEMIKLFEKASGREVPYVIGPRRAGDVAECYADPSKANEELAWHAEKTIEDACVDSWRWQSQNPNGFAKE
ncbi:MAG: UDP-glucose 4-epimerase GalE [Candidatus Saccharimonadales bacterium]